MKRCLFCAMFALFLASGCDKCKEGEERRWVPCTGKECGDRGDTVGEWRCVAKTSADGAVARR